MAIELTTEDLQGMLVQEDALQTTDVDARFLPEQLDDVFAVLPTSGGIIVGLPVSAGLIDFAKGLIGEPQDEDDILNQALQVGVDVLAMVLGAGVAVANFEAVSSQFGTTLNEVGTGVGATMVAVGASELLDDVFGFSLFPADGRPGEWSTDSVQTDGHSAQDWTPSADAMVQVTGSDGRPVQGPTITM